MQYHEHLALQPSDTRMLDFAHHFCRLHASLHMFRDARIPLYLIHDSLLAESEQMYRGQGSRLIPRSVQALSVNKGKSSYTSKYVEHDATPAVAVVAPRDILTQ